MKNLTYPVIALVLVVCVALGRIPSPAPGPPLDLAPLLLATVRVETPGSFGSGVFISPTHIATAGHVVADHLDVTITPYDLDGNPLPSIPATVAYSLATADLAVLTVADPFPHFVVPHVTLPPARGDPALKIGCGGDMPPHHLFGHVLLTPAGQLTISAPSFPGDSGGPVFLLTPDGPRLVGLVITIRGFGFTLAPHLVNVVSLSLLVQENSEAPGHE